MTEKKYSVGQVVQVVKSFLRADNVIKIQSLQKDDENFSDVLNRVIHEHKEKN